MEEENRRILARGMHDREKSLAEIRARKELEARRRAQEDDIDRVKKAEEHKVRTSVLYELRSRMHSNVVNKMML